MTLVSSQQRLVSFVWAVLALMVLTFFLSGCATPKAKKATQIYDDQGNRIGGATDTYEFTQIYPYHYDDVFDAAYKALFRNGFQIEREDREHGIIQGSTIRRHLFSGGSLSVPFTVSVKVREASADPRTELKLVLDTHWGIFSSSLTVAMEPPSEKFGPELVADIQKILTTFD